MPRKTPVALVAGVALIVSALVGCDSTARPPSSVTPTGVTPTGVTATPAAPAAAQPSGSVPAASEADWPTFGHDNARSGVAPGFPTLTKPAVAWRASLDGAVYGQPLVIGDTVYAATEHDTVYALTASTGSIRWSRHLGTPVPLSKLPCGNIDPLGITGTMVYDPATRRVFAVAETTGGAHTLYGLDAATGAIALHRNVDPPKGDRLAHQQRSALTLLSGRVYIAYGGLNGDCADYIGSVVGSPTTGDGPTISYAIPTAREGGIWAPGGGSLSTSGQLLYAVGNGESTSGAYDGSDSVIALDPATLHLVDRFSPSTWATDNRDDLDLGSMTPAVVGAFVYANGKQGSGYALKAGHFGGIGGNVGTATVCKAFGAGAVAGSTVYVPCIDGTRAVTIGPTGALHVAWHTSASTNGSPMLGGGVLWVTDWHAGTLYGLDPASGSVRTRVDLGALPHFATPTLVRGSIYVGTMAGVIALR